MALAAVRAAIKTAKPDAILVAGDLVLNGPDPAATVDAIRELEADGAIVQGNTDIAVADFDYAAAFPSYTDGGSPTRSATPPSGPTTRSATSGSTGSAGCPPSAGCGSTTCSSW